MMCLQVQRKSCQHKSDYFLMIFLLFQMIAKQCGLIRHEQILMYIHNILMFSTAYAYGCSKLPF